MLSLVLLFLISVLTQIYSRSYMQRMHRRLGLAIRITSQLWIASCLVLMVGMICLPFYAVGAFWCFAVASVGNIALVLAVVEFRGLSEDDQL